MIFRWSFWGTHLANNAELLKCSVLTFKQHFGNGHDYVVCTDNTNIVEEIVGGIASVIDFNQGGKSIYDIESKATWKKWCPKVRLDINKTEIYIDSDVFLLKFPSEIEQLIADPKIKFAIMDEFCGQPWQHGAMKNKITDSTPFVNCILRANKSTYSAAK